MTPATKRKPLKKNSSRRIRTSIRGHWQHVSFRVRHTPDYLTKGTDHLELVVIERRCQRRACSRDDKGHAFSTTPEPLPITETGYLSHFVDDREVPNAKAALAFFLEWIAREARSKRWQTADNKRRQLDLFT